MLSHEEMIRLQFTVAKALHLHCTRESNKGVMTVLKYSFLLANSFLKYKWEIYILPKYGNFVLNIQNFEKTLQTFLNEYKKSN